MSDQPHDPVIHCRDAFMAEFNRLSTGGINPAFIVGGMWITLVEAAALVVGPDRLFEWLRENVEVTEQCGIKPLQ